ncbi:MAG: serine/threonine-protein phosphatase [Proteobacteria bacterium]|nr:serine/threonine-protein phosphatase [Pseudomonadota bacterium]
MFINSDTSKEDMTSVQNKNKEESIPAAITDIGCEREINEDRYAVVDSPLGQAWIVCDGMGGVLGGELAAQLAIDAIRRALENGDYENSKEALRTAVEEANRIIVLRRQNPAFGSMGTTVVAVIINDEEVVITHAGDSRAYLLTEGQVAHLTKDHTYVQEMVERGEITPEEAMDHPQSHVLVKCLGAEPRLGLDFKNLWLWPLAEGQKEDKIILCSDGLYSLVTDDEIAEITTNFTPQEACVKLVEMAKDRGGFDNITLSILPLNGRLKDQELPVDSSLRKVKSKSRYYSPYAKDKEEKMPLGKRILLFSLFILLGAVVTSLFILITMMK